MFDARTGLIFFAFLKNAAGTAFKNVAPAPGSEQTKNRLQLYSCPKSEGSSRLRNTGPSSQNSDLLCRLFTT